MNYTFNMQKMQTLQESVCIFRFWRIFVKFYLTIYRRNGFSRREEIRKSEFLVDKPAYQRNALAHRESREHRADAQALDVTQTEKRQPRRYRKAGDVEADLYPRILNARDVGKFAREKVGRDYRQTAAV